MNEHAMEDPENLRAEIERRVGQCILQLQRYELGLKRFLSTTVIRGSAETLKANHEARKAGFANKTLGQLIGEVTGQYLFPSSPDEDFWEGSNESLDNPVLPEIHFQLSMPMSQENYNALKAELAEIVSIRNELVHHFLERFDLHDAASCNDALEHLASIKQGASHHFKKLREWDSARRASIQQAVEFLDSEAFESLLSYGFYPGRPMDWTSTTAVQLLKYAEGELQRDGWTDLKAALALIKQQRPDLGPQIYQCKSWRHLLQKSGLFELRKLQHLDQRASTLFRSR